MCHLAPARRTSIRADQISAMTTSMLRFGVVFTARLCAGNDVLFFGPGAEVDLLAALTTERTVFVGLGPFDFPAAGRAIDDGCHDAVLLNVAGIRNCRA